MFQIFFFTHAAAPNGACRHNRHDLLDAHFREGSDKAACKEYLFLPPRQAPTNHRIGSSPNGQVGSNPTSARSAASCSAAFATARWRATLSKPHQRCCNPRAVPRLTLGCNPRVLSRASAGTSSIDCRLHLPYTSAPRHCKDPKPLVRT